MIYKDFKGKKISSMALGTMRLPIIGDDNGNIDKEAAFEMIDYAYKNGINYFDTAWGYHNGEAQKVVGEALKRYPRESFYLTQKFPGYDLSLMGQVEEIFEKQLEYCQTEYFDFYLIHNLCELNVEQYCDEKYGILKYLLEQKKNGRIKHLGFSNHGRMDCVKKFMSVYGPYMEFAQLQLNYFDYKFQEADKMIEYLKEFDLPIFVMEPLRGGALTRLPENEAAKLEGRGMSQAEWGFRFLQGIPEVTVVLTGSSTLEQLKDSMRIFSEDKPLCEKDLATLMGVAESMAKSVSVPCTACRYCTSHCPMKLDIPYLISLYNQFNSTNEKPGKRDFISTMAVAAMNIDEKPNKCIACGACKTVCPQQLQIPEIMADFTKKLKLD